MRADFDANAIPVDRQLFGGYIVQRDSLRHCHIAEGAQSDAHGHIDHAGGAAELAEALDLPIEGPHRADEFLLSQLDKQGQAFGITDSRAVVPGRWLDEGDTVSVGDLTFEVHVCPGHTPGHVVFINPTAGFALVGDTLFAGSIGRTDFPYGDHAALIAGIREKLLVLPDEVTFLPGHGPASTIGAERGSNPFLQG
jgi:glyoxylase-like metal-dependent hydrolase (beta-lactamase superfamily II)